MYFHCFGTKYISQEAFSKVEDMSITRNLFRIQDDDYNMCRFNCIAFMEQMIARKTLLHYTKLCLSNGYKKNKIKIYRYFKDKYGKKNGSF